MRNLVTKVVRASGIDRGVFWSMATQCVRLGSGALIIGLFIKFLTADEQGYYYAFNSVLALSIFLELGFSQNIVQFAAHEAAQIEFGPLGSIEGNPESISRLVSLGRFAFVYNGIAGVAFALLIGTGGYWYFATSMRHGAISWQLPWLFVFLSSAVTLAMNPCWALLEGSKQIAEVAFYRFLSASIGAVVMALALTMRAGIYTAAIIGLANILFGVAYVAVRWRGFFKRFSSKPASTTINWRRDIWPFQWRIGISWLSGYFIGNSVNIVVFRLSGPAAAGKIGMTIQIVRIITSFAGTFTAMKVPNLGSLVAARRWDELHSIWAKASLRTLAFSFLGIGALLGFIVVARHQNWHFATRLSGLKITALIGAGYIIQLGVNSLAVYLRAFKREPYVPVSLISGVLTAIFVYFLTRLSGPPGAAWGYATAAAVTAVPAALIFLKKRHEYRADF